MITLQQALDEQKDLDTLCASRPNPSRDVFAPNGHYGVADIYKTYAGLPVTISLSGIVPHGVELDPTWLWHEEVNSRAKYVYCYPGLRRGIYGHVAKKRVIMSASPFLYVDKMLRDQQGNDRKGTILLPVHSTDHIRVRQDYAALATKLIELPSAYHPVSVCLYWGDYLYGAGKEFTKRGIPIVSAGHIYDREFLYRLYHLLSRARFAASNGLGAHLYYAVAAGCSYFNMDIGFKWDAPAPVLARDCSLVSTFVYQKDMKRLFDQRVPNPTAEQLRVVNYCLSAGQVKTREGLRNDLLVT